jgi:hypothetical protein
MKTNNQGNAVWFKLMVLCMLIMTACQRPAVMSSDEQDEQRIHDSFLHASDLPTGWYRDYFGTDEEEGDLVYEIAFRVTDQPGLEYIVVSQAIIPYEDADQAGKAFEKWAKPALWGKVPVEISFQSQADEFEIGCLYSTTEIQPENFCTAVARYDRLISVLMVKTWDEDDKEQWFTWADFERALEAMDRQALEAAGR